MYLQLAYSFGLDVYESMLDFFIKIYLVILNNSLYLKYTLDLD